MGRAATKVQRGIEDGRQYRSIGSMEAKESGRRIETDFYVEGYATVFDERYEIPGVMGEIVEGRSLDGADMSDVIMQYDHEGKVLARMSNGTLIVEPDDNGLFVAADLSKSEAARQLYDEIKNGLVCQMSWGFLPGEMDYDADSNLNTIHSVAKVFDVSAVSIPACDATEISARSLQNGAIAKAEAERLQRAKKLQLQARVLILEGDAKNESRTDHCAD